MLDGAVPARMNEWEWIRNTLTRANGLCRTSRNLEMSHLFGEANWVWCHGGEAARYTHCQQVGTISSGLVCQKPVVTLAGGLALGRPQKFSRDLDFMIINKTFLSGGGRGGFLKIYRVNFGLLQPPLLPYYCYICVCCDHWASADTLLLAVVHSWQVHCLCCTVLWVLTNVWSFVMYLPFRFHTG